MPETPASPRTDTPRPGTLVAGRYRLAHLLATGGMAEVWEALDEVLQRPVAVKILHAHLAANPTFTARFHTEAIAAARLRHPSIVSIYDTCHDHGEAIVMELVRGRTLREYLDERGRVDLDDAIHIGADVADALAIAHRAGVVHRDIKPANILLCDDGRVMVTDFGIAKVRDDVDLTDTGTMIGTVKYLAPEQVAGRRVDGRADLYSLGVVLFESLVGAPPFDAESQAATALARLQRPAPRARMLRPGLPSALDELLARALERDPEARFQRAGDLRAALLATRLADPTGTDPTVAGQSPAVADATIAVAVPDRGATAPAPNEPTGRPVPRRRRWLLPTAVAAGVAAALGLAAVLLVETGPGGRALDQLQQPIDQVTGANTIQSAQAFDPQGDGHEYDELAELAIDDDPATVWHSESYQTPEFGNLKSGLGLIVRRRGDGPGGTLRVRTPTPGWTASIYLTSGTPPADLAGWGEPVASTTATTSTVDIDLGSARGTNILIWVTDLGAGNERVEIGDVTVSG